MILPGVTGPLAMVMAAVPPGDSDPSDGHGPEWGEAAPIGLLIWLFMGLALFFLIKSMNRNLRKVPATFDRDDSTAGDGARSDGGDGVAAVGSVTDGGDGVSRDRDAGAAALLDGDEDPPDADTGAAVRRGAAGGARGGS